MRVITEDGLVAQLVEQLPFKEKVLGSNPSRITLLHCVTQCKLYKKTVQIEQFFYLNYLSIKKGVKR